MLIGYIAGVEIHSTRACVAIRQAMLRTSSPEDLNYTECFRNELSIKKDEELLRATTNGVNPDR